MTLSEMRRVLVEHRLELTRSLGQNFLHDANQLRRIVQLAELQPGDRVLEIGPGLGPLTEHLLAAGAGVLAIEKDARLADFLRGRFGVPALTGKDAGNDPGLLDAAGTPGLRLVQADALRLLESLEADWRDWKLVANLPYSVASPLLVTLAQTPQPPERLVVTLQLEVVRRLLAEPDSKDYGILTLLIQLRFEPSGWFKVPRDCFHPAPDVDSGCIRLLRRAEEPLADAERGVFGRVVKRAFSERRKKALKLLKFDWPAATLDAAWRELGLPELARAENLRREHFIELARRLAPHAAAPLPP